MKKLYGKENMKKAVDNLESELKEGEIKWMYEGPKSDVNREDYLLGKKV